MMQAGDLFKKALKEEAPLQIVGVINANHALLAEQSGYKAIYLSGGGVAAGSSLSTRSVSHVSPLWERACSHRGCAKLFL